MAAGAPKASCAVITLVVFGGIISFSLAVVAESKRSRAIDDGASCVWTDGTVSWRVSWISMFFLLLAMFVVNLYGGCVCCSKGKTYAMGPNRALSIIFLAIAWLLFTCSEIMLLTGAIFMDYASSAEPGDKCVELRAGTFAVAGIFGLLSACFGAAYYAQAMRAKYLAWSTQGIQMSAYPVGQPTDMEDGAPQFTIPSHSTAFPSQPNYPQNFH